MSRSLTRRRHCRHRGFTRIRQAASDSFAFLTDQAVRLLAIEEAEGVHGSLCADGESTQTPGARSNQFTFEDVQDAVEATDIDLTAKQINSLDFDNGTEMMRNTQSISLPPSGWLRC